MAHGKAFKDYNEPANHGVLVTPRNRGEPDADRCVPGTARLLAGESAQAGKSRPNQVTVKGSQGQGESR